MTTLAHTAAPSTARSVNSGFKVDISRGERIGRVSSEWYSRPDDERFLSLLSFTTRFDPAPSARMHVLSKVPRSASRLPP